MSQRTLACLSGMVLLAAVRTTLGQGHGVELQQALDAPVQMELPDARIGEIFDKLRQATGAKFVIDDDALALLPYGDQTRLAVTLKNITLRKALSPMLARQALRWEIDRDVIRIRPTDALARTVRRATFEELDVLGNMHTVKLARGDDPGSVIRQLRKATGVDDLKIYPHVKIDVEADYARANRALPCTAAVWLDTLCHSKGWTWYVRSNAIVVLDKELQIQRQLSRQVTLRYQNSPLVTVLLDLAYKGRVRLTLAPGVMNYLPSATRQNFNLTMGQASIAQALEVISGATGLQFVKSAEGIRVEASESLKAEVDPARRRTGRPQFFVRLTLVGPEGTNIEVFMRPEELPPDILKMIDRAKEKLISQLRGEDLGEVIDE